MSLTDLAEELAVKTSAYVEGFDGYWDGVMYEQNPYTLSSGDYLRWQEGWLAAESSDTIDF